MTKDNTAAGVKVAAIISDDEIVRVHGNANFGSMSPREVVNDGIRKCAVGYHCGHTQWCILREHGLITASRAMGADASLTKKGKAYARALLHDVLFGVAPEPSEGWRGSVDDMADRWAEECGVRAMAEAVGDVFSKWADAELLSRFHEQIEALMRQSFMEGVVRAAPGSSPTYTGSDWHRADSDAQTMLYTLRQDGWRKGQPVMVNDVSVTIRADNGSALSKVEPVVQTILAALSAQPVSPSEGDDEQRRDAWSDFESEHLTDGKGHAAADVYARCRDALNAAWPNGRNAAIAAAVEALPAGWSTVKATHPSDQSDTERMSDDPHERWGILNHVGTVWTDENFETEAQATAYLDRWKRENPKMDLSKHRVIPVLVTIRAALGEA